VKLANSNSFTRSEALRFELSPAAPQLGADSAGSSRGLAILADEGAAQDREELLLMNSLDD
jgi:hypothetical protein